MLIEHDVPEGTYGRWVIRRGFDPREIQMWVTAQKTARMQILVQTYDPVETDPHSSPFVRVGRDAAPRWLEVLAGAR